MGGKVRIWKQARKLEINSELKSAGLPLACRRRRPNGRFSHWELIQTSLRFRLSRKPRGRRAKDKEKKGDSEASLSTAAVIKLGTRPAPPPPRLKTRSNREPTPTHNSHNTQHTRVKQNTLCFMQKDTQPSQTCSGGNITPIPTQNRCG